MSIEKKMEEIESYARINEQVFTKEIEIESLDALRDLECKLGMYKNLTAKGQPLQHRKIVILSEILTRRIATKEKEHLKMKEQADEEWAKREVPKNLGDIRVLTNPATVQSIRRGVMRSEDTREWKKPESTTIEIVTGTGRKLKIDLMRLISSKYWRVILENPLQTFFFPIETGGTATKHGKRIGFWRADEGFTEEQKIKPVIHDTYLAIRRV